MNINNFLVHGARGLALAFLVGTGLTFSDCKDGEDQPEGEDVEEETDYRVTDSFQLQCGQSRNVPVAGKFLTVANPGSCKTVVELMHSGGSEPPLETLEVGDSSSMTIQAGTVYGQARIRCVGEAPNGECQYTLSTKSTPPGNGTFHMVNGFIPLTCGEPTTVYAAFNTRPTIVKVKFTSTCGGNNDHTIVTATPIVNGVPPDVISTGDGYIVILPVGDTGRGTVRAQCNGDGNNPCTVQVWVN